MSLSLLRSPAARSSAKSAQIASAAGTVLFEPPAADLAPQFEYLWQLVLPTGSSPDSFWRVVVDGYVDIALRIPLTDELLRNVENVSRSDSARRAVRDTLAASRSVICGAASSSRSVPMTVPLLLTGARFRLGAARGILGNELSALVDGSTPISDLMAARSNDEFAEALGQGVSMQLADDPHAQAHDRGAEALLRSMALASVQSLSRRLVARALANQPASAPLVERRVKAALRLLDSASNTAGVPGDALAESTGARIASIARELAVSHRTLERLFAEHVGFAPRTYQRLRRVGAVAASLEKSAAALRLPGERRASERAPTLSALAQDLGYTDHAHMTREFTKVMGVVPSTYRREAQRAVVEKRVGAVQFERSIPLGTIGVLAAP